MARYDFGTRLYHLWRIGGSPVAWAFLAVEWRSRCSELAVGWTAVRASIVTAAILPLGIGAYRLIDRVLSGA